MPVLNESEGRELSERIHGLIDEWNEKSLIPSVNLGLSIVIHEAGPTNAKDVLSIADQKLYQDKDMKKKLKK